MKGKHAKNRFPLGPRATGALFGLAFFGVVAGTAQASIGSESDPGTGSRSGDQIAAMEVLPHKQKGARDASREKAEAEKSTTMDARSRVIARARTWNPGTDDRVRYSQVRSHNGYRADCSGFVSMTLGLEKPGPNTQGLTSSRYTERIDMDDLKKGDLVMDAQGTNTTRHVVIFEKWANKDRTSYWAYEQRGRYGTDYRERDYGLDSGSQYKAYRPKNL
ncbi:peptidoglycan endopeptidase [Actinomadura sp. KC216]|uniref:C40 family peptidase n=1 Tax=Actinomadura sp. KC216 TaxID=2530370 RepID=UPI00104E9873|nr:C40 family peptidase [Actinomadura sp. KC216]TDB80971.1 peptidoglycan endopeptidase [Actinomadura sp. KC216]